MRKLALIVALCFVSLTFAQQGINYKALIKDANNAVVANQSITVQFSILQGVAQTNVYQETHTPTTDANGIVIVNIGEGTVVSGVFDNIDWASDDHFLNTQINTGSGLVDMGTTGFKTVPYALSAKTAENVTGLEAISVTEPVGFPTGGTGLVKKDRNSSNYGTVGYEAIDLSFSNTADNTLGATGPGSLATGFETTASGGASTALGNSTVASGEDSSTAMGSRTTASGDNATAMGYETIASGFSSTTMGRNTTAESYGQTTLGLYNVPTTANDAENFNALDHILVVGNGEDDSNTSDALVILKNGTITAPSFDISEITDNKALITKEYAEANLANSGLETIDEGNGIGLVKVGRVAANYGNIGDRAVDLSNSSSASSTLGATNTFSTALGENTMASGSTSTALGGATTASAAYSTAMGLGSEASGIWSTAMGKNTIASQDVSTAMGSGSIASGQFSTAMGENTTASGKTATAVGGGTNASGFYTTATGLFTNAESYVSFTLGRYNVGGGNNSTWVATDPLFEIGNGLDDANRANALTVLKDGTTTISGSVTATAFVGDGSGLTNLPAGFSGDYGDLTNAPIEFNATSGNGVQTPDNNASGNYATAMGTNTIASGNFSTSFGLTTGALGNFSTAMGYENFAGGTAATAMGQSTTASGDRSTAMGSGSIASGQFSTAMGENTTAINKGATAIGGGSNASGWYTTATGLFTDAESYVSFAIGRYNVGGGNNSSWVATDPLFEVGNGSSDNSRSNALTILKDGTITAPSLDIAEITDNKALITKEYADANLGGSGLEAIDEGSGNGLVKIGRVAENYGPIGMDAVDLSFSSNVSSTNGATGDNALALGLNTNASGIASLAMGGGSIASGVGALAAGVSAVASGYVSAAFGDDTQAESNASFVIGRNNVGGGDPINWVASDPLFEIGNGVFNNANALTVLKNGNATLAGSLTQNSDRRLKTEIADLHYGLNAILQLNPVSYYWKKHRDSQNHRSLGLIAQEVQPILKELISVGMDENKTLSLDYVSLVPVLIKGIQEQQVIIETQAKRIEALEKKEKLYASLEARLSALETANTNEDEVAVATTETTKE